MSDPQDAWFQSNPHQGGALSSAAPKKGVAPPWMRAQNQAGHGGGPAPFPPGVVQPTPPPQEIRQFNPGSVQSQTQASTPHFASVASPIKSEPHRETAQKGGWFEGPSSHAPPSLNDPRTPSDRGVAPPWLREGQGQGGNFGAQGHPPSFPMQPSNLDSFDSSGREEDFENEPPLLEELDIHPEHILQRVLSVVFFRNISKEISESWDLGGPLAIWMSLGVFLVLAGKLHFAYIYGLTLVGTVGMYSMVNLMTPKQGLDLYSTLSILLYGLLPMVFLAAIGVVWSLKGTSGIVVSLLAIAWSAGTASRFFGIAVDNSQQRLLVAYPVLLLYGSFALMVVF